MMMKNRRVKTVVKLIFKSSIFYIGATAVIVISLMLSIKHVTAQNSAAVSNEVCERQAAIVSSRSTILKTYKSQEDKEYKLKREKWATRIEYAGQWTKGSAEDAREALYKYDELHKAFNTELDNQIQQYEPLLNAPLECTNDQKKAEVKQKVDELKGIKDGKAVSGQALIEKLKRDETNFANKEFKKTTDKLIKEMRKAKEDNPVPNGPKLEVKKL